MDAGAINNSYTVRIINDLKSKNYEITLIHIKTPLSVCLERLKKRNRKVPVSSIVKKAGKEVPQFQKLKKLADKTIIVPYFSNKYVFVDMDGVIAALGVLPYHEGKVDFVNSQIHKYLKPVSQVIEKLNNLKDKEIYILSAIPTSINLQEKFTKRNL